MKTTMKKMWRLGIVSLVAFNLLLPGNPIVAAEPTFSTIDVRSTRLARSWDGILMPMA